MLVKVTENCRHAAHPRHALRKIALGSTPCNTLVAIGTGAVIEPCPCSPVAFPFIDRSLRPRPAVTLARAVREGRYSFRFCTSELPLLML
jgi:hypothetical protein